MNGAEVPWLWKSYAVQFNGRHPPAEPKPDPFQLWLEELGRLMGVHRQEFETEWAFARYLQIRLGYFIKDELARHVDRLFLAMEDSCAPSANGPDADALNAEAS